MYVNRCSKNDVEYLRSLCIRHPDYKMTQLAKEMDRKVSDIFMMIKDYDLPYQWKK